MSLTANCVHSTSDDSCSKAHLRASTSSLSRIMVTCPACYFKKSSQLANVPSSSSGKGFFDRGVRICAAVSSFDGLPTRTVPAAKQGVEQLGSQRISSTRRGLSFSAPTTLLPSGTWRSPHADRARKPKIWNIVFRVCREADEVLF